MANIIGIDLGTTYSVVAHLTPDGRAEVIRDSDNQNLTPSVVYAETDNDIYVGWEAKRESVVSPDSVAEHFKRRMGETDIVRLGNREFTPTDLSALVLRKIAQIAQESIGQIDAAVITVPANFTNQARQDTMAAGKAAGLKVEHIVNEPTAAAIYYAQQQHVQGKVVVYDLGGGTFDCSVVEVMGQNVNILSSLGNQRLGGHDFDNKLLALIQGKYEAQTGSDYKLKNGDFSGKDIEELKKSLSKRSKINVSVAPPTGGRVNIEVTQDEFSDSISTLVKKAEMLVEGALDEVDLKPSDINHVVLVGGSTRVPSVRENVQKFFKQEPKATANVDEAVALGATIYAALKATDLQLNAAQISAASIVDLEEICNHFFGTVSLHYDEETGRPSDRVSILIKKNSRIPAQVSDTFYTVHDGQVAVSCIVTQSPAEELDPRWVTKVWEGELGPLPPNRPSGQSVKVTFAYDSNAVLHCTFVDEASGLTEQVSIDQRIADGSKGLDIEDFIVE